MRNPIVYVMIFLMFSCAKNEDVDLVSLNVTTAVSPDIGGTILFSDSPPYKAGQNITITAVAAPNYKFSHWEGALTGLEVSKQLVLSNNIEVVAFFIPLERFAQENIVLYNEQGIDHSGYIFVMENGQKNAYLVNHEGEKLKE